CSGIDPQIDESPRPHPSLVSSSRSSDSMNTRPTPRKVHIERKPDELAIVNLTFTKAYAEAYRRCDLGRAEPGPTRGRVSCTNEMPAAAAAGFLWGSRVDRAATPAPGPAGPRKPRRRRKKSIDDVAADQVAALAS